MDEETIFAQYLGSLDKTPCETCGPSYDEMRLDIDENEVYLLVSVGCYSGTSYTADFPVTDSDKAEMIDILDKYNDLFDTAEIRQRIGEL